VAESAEQNVVTFENLGFSYDRTPVLEGVNLSIRESEFVWVVGPNGGGKTTLVKIMLGLLRPRKGRVRVFGKEPSVGRRRIGYMPQHAKVDLQFPVTVMDVALMGRLGKSGRWGRYSSADREVATSALEDVGLLEMSRRSLSELSGGQQRRLLIARALSSEPDLLVLDEPTANLDKRSEQDLLDLFVRFRNRVTVVMVSHDPAFVSDFVKHVVCVNKTVSVHPTADIDGEFMQELFGTSMRVVRHDLHRGSE